MIAKTQFAWHIHHEVLVEPLIEPIETRIAYIRVNKPAHEVELRLRLLKVVKGELPQALNKAWAAYDKAWAAYDKAWAAYDKAWAARDKARAASDKAWAARDKAWAASDKAWAASDKAWVAYKKVVIAHSAEIETLHRQECPDCPWEGKSIFPKEQ